MITIIDYGMGNLRSVQKGFERVGAGAEIASDPERIRRAEKLVLPGVGAFADAMRELRDRQLVEPILESIGRGRPFLGICLGLQLLFERSFEDGEHPGLGILAGDVVRFGSEPGLKIPHMGWNILRIRRRPPILGDIADQTHVYFVHSYYVTPRDDQVIATETDYPRPFTSMVWRDNIFASQFHPEKSQAVGLGILARFAAL